MELKKFDVLYSIKGMKKTITIVAENKPSAIAQVASKTGGNVLTVTPTKETSQEIAKKRIKIIKNILFKKAIKTDELIGLFKQIAVMVKAGMSITDSLRESVQAVNNKRLVEIIEDAVQQIESGKTFNEALLPYEYELGRLSLSIIKMGEETGELAEALYDLNEILDEMARNKARIKKAMKQPIITIGILIAAMVGLIVMIIPKFKTIFDGLGADLPMPTQWLIFLSDLFQNYGLHLILSLIAIIFIHNKTKALNQKYEFGVDKFKFKLPIFGKVIKYGMVARFITVFNKLLRAGVPMSESIDTAYNTVDNLYLKGILKQIKYKLTKGGTISEIFKETNLFTTMDIKMIKAGEDSGELNNMLNHVSNRYKEEFDTLVENLSALIEPILLAMVTVMVLFLALGIFLPMWSLASAVK
jgi:general secretion pathway protein F/MSHA biogenesis protein MshG